jgi:hypothetical protein
MINGKRIWRSGYEVSNGKWELKKEKPTVLLSGKGR